MKQVPYQGAYSRRRFSNYAIGAQDPGAYAANHESTPTETNEPHVVVGPGVNTSNLKVTAYLSWPAKMGRINGNGINYSMTEKEPSSGTLTALFGSTVTIEATPKAGYRFVRWQGGPVDGMTSPQVSFKLTMPCVIKAVFEVYFNIQHNPVNPGSGGNGGENPSDNPPGGNGGEPPVSGGGNGDEPPVSGGGNGNGGNGNSNGGNGNGNGGNHTIDTYGGGFVDTKLIPFVRQWWWAILIVAYIAYKEWKGGKQ